MNKKIDLSPTPIRSDFLVTMPEIRRIPEFVEFAKWYAMPSNTKKEKTQKEFAGRVGVCEDTLGDWKRHPDFWPLVREFLRDRMQEQIPDVIEGLYKKIVGGNGGASDVRFFLQLAGDESPEPKQINQPK